MGTDLLNSKYFHCSFFILGASRHKEYLKEQSCSLARLICDAQTIQKLRITLVVFNTTAVLCFWTLKSFKHKP